LHNGGIKPTVTSSKIDEYWMGDWNKFEEDCTDFNHKVLSVKFVGYEDVYNITVDTHHNYFIVTNESETDTNSKLSGILSQNCGEQPLPPKGACLLGSIDLTKFVENPFTDEAYFDFDKFADTVDVFTRMLDNVVEYNNLPLESQREEILRKRRHGMGFFGLGSALTLLGIRYDSLTALEFAEKVTKLMAIRGYETGCQLAKEKGSAPILDEYFELTPEIVKKCPLLGDLHLGQRIRGIDLFLQSPYMQRLLEDDSQLKQDLLLHGCRFTHHTSIAPTGTISLALGNNTSGGIEPSFSHQYFRNLTTEGKKTRQQQVVYSKEFLLYKELYGKNKTDEQLLKDLPDYFVTADTISWEAHLNMVAAVQKWVDSSISKTCNVPTEILFKEFEGVYNYAYQAGCKAVSTFRYNPETLGAILSRSEDLAKSRYEFTLADGTVIQCAGGDHIEYDGEVTTAENLFSALKENTYGKF
jgi:ribonucleoside-diphosphate reductase alpha chain